MHSKDTKPVYPPGSIIGYDVDNHRVQIDPSSPTAALDMFRSGSDESVSNVIASLFFEVALLRKIVKEMVRREGVHISSPNEFHRGLASFAHKLQEDPDVVWELLKPYYEDFLKQMFERPTRQQAHGSHDHQRHGNRRSGGGH